MSVVLRDHAGSHGVSPNILSGLAEAFTGLGDYKDSRKLAEHCRKRAVEERAKIDTETARQKAIAEQKRKEATAKKKKLAVVIVVIIVVVVAAALLMTKVIIPGNAYKKAESLLANGQYEEASAAFEALGGYKDSADRVLEAKYAEAESLLASGQKAEAAFAFSRLTGYQDARMRSLELWDSFAVREMVSTGVVHTVGLKSDGTVVAVGDNLR